VADHKVLAEAGVEAGASEGNALLTICFSEMMDFVEDVWRVNKWKTKNQLQQQMKTIIPFPQMIVTTWRRLTRWKCAASVAGPAQIHTSFSFKVSEDILFTGLCLVNI